MSLPEVEVFSLTREWGDEALDLLTSTHPHDAAAIIGAINCLRVQLREEEITASLSYRNLSAQIIPALEDLARRVEKLEGERGNDPDGSTA